MISCALVALLAAAPRVLADTDQGRSLSLGGDSPPMCAIISPPTGNQASNMSLSQADLGKGHILIEQLVDAGSAQLRPSSMDLSFGVTCNAPHQVAIRSVNGALEPDTPVTTLAEGFATEVNYTAVLTWNGESIAITADGNAATAQSASITDFAVTGKAGLELRVDASLNDMTRPLVEGRYIDTLVIEITPQF